ncbi:hypothetical protein HN512_00940 [Candidatus Peregrinibacteria bacterium]|jgi:hypothetical protein|nr:hypothetical protein [Candidatus Peregrinibacteria bacterium]MBT3598384.1 hypothetical protein [Candidatus Peregrinibacteria bacterium]MBT6730421.1 hypothetical protein [Candidatus Peregrinibacteria bacterium]MBT7008979.1 hypothetical protein [Candidatus Peregrinibacteria bacterium]MBT7928849.1 hypothetical protein [Candidatus Peregrinibacteria bacterium]
MNKTVIAAIGGTVVVAAIGITVMRGGGNPIESPSSISMEDYVNGKIGNAHCTLSMNEAGGDMEIDLFISGLRMYMENTVKHAGGTMKSYMLNDGEYVHMWGNGQAFSMKYDAEEAINSGATGETTDQNLADILSNQSMDCEKWKVDESLFEKPSDITFSDLSGGLEIDNMYETVEGGDAPTDPEPLDLTPGEAQKLLEQLQGGENSNFGDHYQDLME